MTTYTSQYPPGYSNTYIKATTYYSNVFYPHFTCNPSLSLTGTWNYTSWVSGSRAPSQNRFHIDLGESKIIRRIYYENGHLSGTRTNAGAKNISFLGSNESDAFADLVYTHDTDWTELSISQSTFDQHVSADQADPKYIAVNNSVSFRFYAFKIADNYGYGEYTSIRRIVLQTEDGYGSEAIYVPRIIMF